MKLTINALKVALAEKDVKGLNALIGAYYGSNIAIAVKDINRYANSHCNAISWYGDITPQKLQHFFDLAEEDLETFIYNWLADGLSFGEMQLDTQQIANLAIYGLNPKCLPKDDDLYVISYIQNIRRTVLLGWIDTIVNNLLDSSMLEAA